MTIKCPFKHGLRKALADKKAYEQFLEEHRDDWIAASADLF